MPSRTHDPLVIQSSRFNCMNVLDPEDQAVVRNAVGRREVDDAALPRDVRRDAERDDVREVAGDVDVAAADVEGARVDRVAVGILGLRRIRIRVVRVDRDAHLDRRRVVGRRESGRRRHLSRGRSCRERHHTNCHHRTPGCRTSSKNQAILLVKSSLEL